MAIVNMTAMVNFYTQVFELNFEPVEMFGTQLFKTKWGSFNVLFCPASLAGNNAQQNRHQLDIYLDDLDNSIKKVVSYGGQLMGEVSETDLEKSIGIIDPDQNTMVLKSLKN